MNSPAATGVLESFPFHHPHSLAEGAQGSQHTRSLTAAGAGGSTPHQTFSATVPSALPEGLEPQHGTTAALD